MTRTMWGEGQSRNGPSWLAAAAAAGVFLALGAWGCGGPQQGDGETEILGRRIGGRAEAEGPEQVQCFSVCANDFTLCSGNVHPGEFSRCTSQRRACEVDCEQRQGLLRGEQGSAGVGPTPEEIQQFREGGTAGEAPEERAPQVLEGGEEE